MRWLLLVLVLIATAAWAGSTMDTPPLLIGPDTGRVQCSLTRIIKLPTSNVTGSVTLKADAGDSTAFPPAGATPVCGAPPSTTPTPGATPGSVTCACSGMTQYTDCTVTLPLPTPPATPRLVYCHYDNLSQPNVWDFRGSLMVFDRNGVLQATVPARPEDGDF